MTTHRDALYEVVRTPGFPDQWEEGLRSSRIPPGRQASLDHICSEVLVPRLTYRSPEIEAGYTIIGDDATVFVEDVLRIGSD